MDDPNALRWCLLDSLCVGVVVGGVGVVVGAGRRLWVACEWPRHKRKSWRVALYCLCGAGTTGLVGFSLVVIGGEKWPTQLKGIAAFVLLATVAWDFSSDSFARFIRGSTIRILRSALRESVDILDKRLEKDLESLRIAKDDELSEDSR